MSPLRKDVETLLRQAKTPRGRRKIAKRKPGLREVRLSGDRFVTSRSNAARPAHRLISAVLKERLTTQAHREGYTMALSSTDAGKEIAAQSTEENLEIVRAAVLRALVLDVRMVVYAEDRKEMERWIYHNAPGWLEILQPRRVIGDLIDALLRRRLPVTEDDLLAMGTWIAISMVPNELYACRASISGLVNVLSHYSKSRAVSEPLRQQYRGIVAALRTSSRSDTVRLADRLEAGLGAEITVPLETGEAWSDEAMSDLEGLPADQGSAWAGFLQHMLTASAAKPSAKWLKAASQLLEPIGPDALRERLVRWFPFVDKPRTSEGSRFLRGKAAFLLAFAGGSKEFPLTQRGFDHAA